MLLCGQNTKIAVLKRTQFSDDILIQLLFYSFFLFFSTSNFSMLNSFFFGAMPKAAVLQKFKQLFYCVMFWNGKKKKKKK